MGFFNHAAKFAEVIAFIIPRSWKKDSIINRLDLNFKLVKSVDLDSDIFYGDKCTAVKCCFQIWEKSLTKREKLKRIEVHKDFEILPSIKKDKDYFPNNDADFIILGYGQKCGQVSYDLKRWRPKSVHFIKSNIDIAELYKRFEKLDYSCAENSSRQGSLSRADLVELYTKQHE